MTYQANIINSLKKNWKDIVLILTLFLTTPLFFFKLGDSSLFSWDEAWYADIARNIAYSGNLIFLFFNNQPYYDHPPAGFWIMAASIKLFGDGELAVRLPSAIFGIGCLIATYFLGKRIFNRVVGFLSAVSLSSAFWFISRARSGNLDIFLTFFFLTTIYFAVKSTDNKWFFLPFFISLFFLIFMKTLIPFTVIPVLVFIFLNKKMLKEKLLWIVLTVTFVIFGSWFYLHKVTYPDFINHYFGIGLPGVKKEASLINNLILLKSYIHNGIGKWFWPGVLSAIFATFFFRRSFFILIIFSLSFFLPFIFSHRGQIWHLIPLYPFLLLSFYGLSFYIADQSYAFFKRKIRKIIFYIPIILFFLYFYFFQIKLVWYQIIDIPKFVSDEELLSQEASKYNQKLYVYGDFLPTAVYYSKKHVTRVHEYQLKDFFEKSEDFLIIIDEKLLDQYDVTRDKIEVLKKDRERVLILHKG